jgi:hypothetical protein
MRPGDDTRFGAGARRTKRNAFAFRAQGVADEHGGWKDELVIAEIGMSVPSVVSLTDTPTINPNV